ncbi:response regulator transcription factor [Listeria booriae]|uniref:Response regulator transcription factor n=1 Tax=Listeria booriae TaxID=1552123 RepID=A0A7X0XHJ7_9LIST|nr:response regulator transcription factor [Listeria booriae]MBC1561160.1 response regulator transcription factor [Listeria booriae]MBC1889825.1 response regulator transcription factor [Listeria booriae]MBC2208083.1 response regulator transcription factor [Listeria booriae]MBC2363970.1 response regulator transcription factor [Listeria booriae]MBC2369620.1 response regulator transcription factor [Listeria booriae]
MKHILVVEDDANIRDVTYAFLVDEGYQVTASENGMEAFGFFENQTFDLIIMDIMMPKMDGYTLCELIRTKSDTPILMLTALGEEDSELKGFELGADDYIQKPFSYKVLIKRVEALLRRVPAKQESPHLLQVSDIALNTETFQVTARDFPVELTRKEFDILRLLMQNPGRVFTREMLLEQAWDYEYIVDTKIINTHIKNLRKKLATDKIQTVRGAGYKMDY